MHTLSLIQFVRSAHAHVHTGGREASNDFEIRNLSEAESEAVRVS